MSSEDQPPKTEPLASETGAVSPELVENFRLYISGRIDDFKSSRDWYRRGALRARIAIMALGAVTSVLLGLDLHDQFAIAVPLAKNVALILSATVTFISGYDAFMGNRALWLAYNDTLMNLYSIRSDLIFEANLQKPITEGKLRELHERVSKVLEDANKAWKADRSATSGTQSSDGSGTTKP